MGSASCTSLLAASWCLALLLLKSCYGCTFDSLDLSGCAWKQSKAFTHGSQGICLRNQSSEHFFPGGNIPPYEIKLRQLLEPREKAGCHLSVVGTFKDADLLAFATPYGLSKYRTSLSKTKEHRDSKLSKIVFKIGNIGHAHNLEIVVVPLTQFASACITDVFFHGHASCSDSPVPECTFGPNEGTCDWTVERDESTFSWVKPQGKGYLRLLSLGEHPPMSTKLVSPTLKIKRLDHECKLIYWYKSGRFEENRIYNPIIKVTTITPTGTRVAEFTSGMEFFNDLKWHRASVAVGLIWHSSERTQISIVVTSAPRKTRVFFAIDNLRLTDACNSSTEVQSPSI